MPALSSIRSVGMAPAFVTNTNDMGESLEKLTSQYRGRRRALLVAVNYVQSERGLPRLFGCTKDVELARQLLTGVYGFEENDVMVLADAGPFSRAQLLPTKANILRYLRQLVQDSQEGDIAYFHYSGHGAQAPDTTGKELDGLMELLCPSDMTVSGSSGFDNFIGQQEFKDVITSFHPGVWGVVVLDCCHSGDDSPGSGSKQRDLRKQSDSPDFRNRKINFASADDQSGVTGGLTAFVSTPPRAGMLDMSGASPAGIPVMWSACGESQTSADATINGAPVGAFSHFFYGTLLASGGDITPIFEVIKTVTGGLKKGRFTQRPIFKVKDGSGRERDPLVPRPGGSFTRGAPPRDKPTAANAITVTSRRDVTPMGEGDAMAVVQKLETQSGLSPEDVQMLETPGTGRRRDPILVWKKGAEGAAPPQSLGWDASQIYARALAAGGFKGLRAAAQLAGDAALLEILSGADLERLSTDTLRDPASSDFMPRGVPADLLDPSTGERTAGERVSAYLQRVLAAVPGSDRSLDQSRAVLWEELRRIGGEACVAAGTPALDTLARDSPDINSTYAEIYSLISPLDNPMLVRSALGVATGLAYDLDFWDAYDDAEARRPPRAGTPADIPGEMPNEMPNGKVLRTADRTTNGGGSEKAEGTSHTTENGMPTSSGNGTPTASANGTPSTLATGMSSGEKITSPPAFLVWDEELNAKVAAHYDFVKRFAGDIDSDAARRAFVASLIAEKGGAGLWFGEIMGHIAVPPWEPPTGTDQMRALGSNVETPVVGLVGEHPREKELLGEILALTASIQGVQVGLDVARAARSGTLTESDRLRHFGALLALCLPEASSRELLYAAWQLVGLETFLRTPEGASGSPPDRWNADTVAGLIAYVETVSGDTYVGDTASELVRATIGKDEEEDALAAELYGLVGPLGWEVAQQIGALSVATSGGIRLPAKRSPEIDVFQVLTGRSRAAGDDERAAAVLLEPTAVLGFCQVYGDTMETAAKVIAEAAKKLKEFMSDPTSTGDLKSDITAMLEGCKGMMETFKTWDTCKEKLLGGLKEKDTGKLMDLLIAYRDYEWRRIWYIFVLPTLRRRFGADAGYLDPDVNEPSGSTVRTSDVDISVWRGSRAGLAVGIFNEVFRRDWNGAESGIVFDVNLYGPDFLRGFEVVGTVGRPQLVLKGHVPSFPQPYGGVQHPTARRWDVSSQMGWALTRLVLNTTDTEYLAFRAAVWAYARGFKDLGFKPFVTQDLLYTVAPERAAGFLNTCFPGTGGVIYRGGGRPIDLLQHAAMNLPLPDGAVNVKASIMARTNMIYEEGLQKIDARLSTFEELKSYEPAPKDSKVDAKEPPHTESNVDPKIKGILENIDGTTLKFNEWLGRQQYEGLESVHFTTLSDLGLAEDYNLAVDYIITTFRDMLSSSVMFANEAYYTEAAVQHAVDIQKARKKHPGSRPPNLSAAEWGVCVQENLASFVEHSNNLQADPGTALLKSGKYLHRALDALRVTLESPDRPYAERLRVAAKCRPDSASYLMLGDELLQRLQRMAGKFMLMKNGSEADVYDDVRNTLLEWWRVSDKLQNPDRETVLKLWFDSEHRREDGCLVYAIMYDSKWESYPPLVRDLVVKVLTPGDTRIFAEAWQRRNTLAEIQANVRDLGAFLYAFYSMAVWPLPESLDRGLRSGDLDDAAGLLSNPDGSQVRDTVWIVTGLDLTLAITPLGAPRSPEAAPLFAKLGSKNQWKVLFAKGGRVRFLSADGRYLARSEDNLAPALLPMPKDKEDQTVTDAVERFDWEIAPVPGAYIEVLIKVPGTETYLTTLTISDPPIGSTSMQTLQLRQIAVPGNKQALQNAAAWAAQEVAIAAAAATRPAYDLTAYETAVTTAEFERDQKVKLLAELPELPSQEWRDVWQKQVDDANRKVERVKQTLATASDAAARDAAERNPEAAKARVEAAEARKAELDKLAQEEPGEVPPERFFRFLYDQASGRYITAAEVQALALAGSDQASLHALPDLPGGVAS